MMIGDEGQLICSVSLFFLTVSMWSVEAGLLSCFSFLIPLQVDFFVWHHTFALSLYRHPALSVRCSVHLSTLNTIFSGE